MLQLPRCLTRTYTLDFHDLTLFEWNSFKKCNCSRKNLLQIQFASQMWAARPHLGSIFEKLLHRKTFILPAAHTLCNPALRKTNCVWFGRIASLSAFVLFAGGCVVRIAYECFLDCSLQEFFMFLEWRTAAAFLFLDSYYSLIIHSLQGTAVPCTPRRAEPARPQLPAARILQPIYRITPFSPVFANNRKTSNRNP